MAEDWYKKLLAAKKDKESEKQPRRAYPLLDPYAFFPEWREEEPIEEDKVPWYERYNPTSRFGLMAYEAEKEYPGVAVTGTPKKPFGVENIPSFSAKSGLVKERPLKERLAEYRELPWYEQLGYEAPVWGVMGVPQLSATKLWTLAGKLPTIARIATRTPIAPFYGLEQGLAVGVGLAGRGIKAGAKPIGKAVEWATRPLRKAYMGAETATTARVGAAQVAAKTARLATPEVEGLVKGQPFEVDAWRGVGKSGVESPAKFGTGTSYAVDLPKAEAGIAEKTAKHFAAGRENLTLEGAELDKAVTKAAGKVTKTHIKTKSTYVTGLYGDKHLEEVVAAATKEAKAKGLYGKAFDKYVNDAITDDLAKKGYDSWAVVADDYIELVVFPKAKTAAIKPPLKIASETTEEVEALALKATSREEFVTSLTKNFKKPKVFITQLNKTYGSVENYMQIVKANERTKVNEPFMQKAIDKLLILIRSSKEKWEPTKLARAAEAGKKAGKIRIAVLSNKGKTAHIAAKGAAKGEMPFEQPIGKALGKNQQESLYEAVNTAYANDNLMEFEYLNASDGLEKIFGGKLPQASEMVQLEKVFGGELIEALLSKRSTWAKALESALDVILLPRTLLASGDFSAPLRQGIFLLPSHPIKATEAFVKSVRMFFDPKYYDETAQHLASRGYGKTGKLSDLFLGMLKLGKGQKLVAREEPFMSRLAEKIPGIGAIVRASERAYTGYLDVFRASVFDSTVQGWGLKAGQVTEDTIKLARYINWVTGRGWAPKSGQELLNAAFFSPRLQTSRIGTPFLITKMLLSESPALRAVAARDTVAFLGGASTALGLASLAGLEVETDWRSADFGKVKWGDTRIDLLGGFGQYAVFAGRMLHGDLASGETKAASGRLMETNRAELILRMARTKASPPVGMAWSFLAGENILGEEVNLEIENGVRDIRDNLMPMAWQDIYDAMENESWFGGLKALPAVFGAGVQTYDSAPQLVSEIRYIYSKGQEVNQEIRELELKHEFGEAAKLKSTNEALRDSQMVSAAYREIDKLEKQKKEIELNPSLSEEDKKERLNDIELRQIEAAIPALLLVDQRKFMKDIRKAGIDVGEAEKSKTFHERYPQLR